MPKFLARALAAVLVLALLGLGGVGWYYAGEILNVERPSEPTRDIEVLEVGRRTVTLVRNAETAQPGRWGVDAPEAYAQVGRIVGSDDESVTRAFTPIFGTLQRGDLIDIDGYAYPGDPERAFDFDVSQVQIQAPLGNQPAWVAKGTDPKRWAVLVHGRAARRSECFRLLEILVEDHDFNVICPTYRNDAGTPQDPNGIYRQGDEEWHDIEPALQYALDQGASEVILGGFSMGGQIGANLLRHSELSNDVDAVIWDAPLLDWGPVVGAGAKDRGVPQWLVPIGMQASEWRAGVDYADLNQVEYAGDFEPPILLIHGTKDTTVPVSVADRFEEARAQGLEYVRVPGAEHVRAWTTATREYKAAVDAFVARTF